MKTAKLLTQSHTTTHHIPSFPPVTIAAAAAAARHRRHTSPSSLHTSPFRLERNLTIVVPWYYKELQRVCAYKVLLNYRMKNTRARYRAIITCEMRKAIKT